MATYVFCPHDPDASALDIAHGEIGLRGERAMNHEAYFDPSHRWHHRAVGDARVAIEAIYGDKPIAGYTGGSWVFDSSTGQPLPLDQAMARYSDSADPIARPDKHNEPLALVRSDKG